MKTGLVLFSTLALLLGACSSTTNQEDPDRGRTGGNPATGGATGGETPGDAGTSAVGTGGEEPSGGAAAAGASSGGTSSGGTSSGGTSSGGTSSGGTSSGGTSSGGTSSGGTSSGGTGGAGGEPLSTGGIVGTGGTNPVDGCRGPADPYCASCCELSTSAVTGVTSCLEYSADGTDWYDTTVNLGATCPQTCPSCAQCTYREQEYCEAIVPRTDCDCANITIGIDPCFAPAGCQCYCSKVRSCTRNCPHLAP